MYRGVFRAYCRSTQPSIRPNCPKLPPQRLGKPRRDSHAREAPERDEGILRRRYFRSNALAKASINTSRRSSQDQS
jgi:hypothetical protein